MAQWLRHLQSDTMGLRSTVAIFFLLLFLPSRLSSNETSITPLLWMYVH